MQGDGDVVPLGGKEVLAETARGSEADGVQHPVDPAPFLGQRLPHRDEVFGLGDVEFQHVDRLRQLATGALGEAQPAPGTGEHDVGSLLLC